MLSQLEQACKTYSTESSSELIESDSNWQSIFVTALTFRLHQAIIQAQMAQDHVYSIPASLKTSINIVRGTSCHINNSKFSAGRSEAKRNLACGNFIG